MNRWGRGNKIRRLPGGAPPGTIRRRARGARGFQLLEMLVALGLIVSVLGVAYELFLRQAEAFRQQGRKVNRQQVLRASLEMITRDLRLAAYPDREAVRRLINDPGIPEAYLPQYPLAVTLRDPVTVTSGGDHPDVLSLLTVLPNETNPAVLTRPALAGDNTLTLSLSPSELNDQYRPGDLLFIGNPPEFALVRAISDRSLTVDTDPLLPGWQGLKRARPSGTEVGEVSLVSYAVFTDGNDPGGRFHEPGRPVLKRKINSGGFDPVAEDIDYLKIQPGPYGSYQLEIGALLEPGKETAAERAGGRWRLHSQVGSRN